MYECVTFGKTTVPSQLLFADIGQPSLRACACARKCAEGELDSQYFPSG